MMFDKYIISVLSWRQGFIEHNKVAYNPNYSSDFYKALDTNKLGFFVQLNVDQDGTCHWKPRVRVP